MFKRIVLSTASYKLRLRNPGCRANTSLGRACIIWHGAPINRGSWQQSLEH